MNAVLLAITLLSVIAAVASSTIAWRVTRDERRRSNARVATLSQAIYDDESATVFSSTALFEGALPVRTDTHRLVAAVAVCVILLGTGVTFVAARSARRPTRPTPASATAADAPLELLALEHDRDGDQLIVRGVVRNPANGPERRGLSALVLLYRPDGRFLTSGRAAIPLATLTPGETAPFFLSVPGADDVERFRLSFRTGAGVEPHVDRRAHQPGEGVTQ